MTETTFARSGDSDSGGKLTLLIDTPVSEPLADAIAALAVVAGIPKAEYVRRVLEQHVYGQLSVVRTMANGSGHGDGRNLG